MHEAIMRGQKTEHCDCTQPQLKVETGGRVVDRCQSCKRKLSPLLQTKLASGALKLAPLPNRRTRRAQKALRGRR